MQELKPRGGGRDPPAIEDFQTAPDTKNGSV
jgi:hypothetical protein